MSILRCVWCIRDTISNPCEHCGSIHVSDRTKPHQPHWSRKTMRTVECKVCDREVTYEEHGMAGDMCQPEQLSTNKMNGNNNGLSTMP